MIRLLSQNLINQIAAGEVVERPSSTVKELVENSLDAGATQIDVVIREGGRSFMSIRDNGFGISKEELPIAIQRHATSKLSDDNLFNIKTMGFRGEALPSIGAISRLSISSRKENCNESWKINVEGGDVSEVIPVQHGYGTTIEVSDLFFATPARLKFLKTSNTETSYIVESLQRLAMAYQNVGFSLKDERRTIFDYKPFGDDLDSSRLSRLSDMMGKDFSENSLKIDAQNDEYKLTGYIGLATLNRASPSHQFLFVNGRPVKDKVFTGAVRVAYQDFLARGRYPMVSLFLEVPPLMVDMNVHPAKTEVRFRDSGKVRGIIIGGIKSALNDAGYKTSTTVSNQALGSIQSNIFPFSKKPFSKQNFNSSYTQKSQNFNSAQLHLKENPHTSYQQMFDSNSITEKISKNEIEQEVNYPLGVAKAQIHETYIVAQSENGLVIVDQHAAHERIVYEKMKSKISESFLQRQALLVPEVIDLKESQIESLEKRFDELSDFGLIIEKFGVNAVLVRETPAILGVLDIKKMILDLVDEIESLGEAVSLKEKIEEVCATISCHGSIRSGRKLNLDEMNELLRQMESTPHSGQCNHGRPTYVEMKKNDIEKLFGRR